MVLQLPIAMIPMLSSSTPQQKPQIKYVKDFFGSSTKAVWTVEEAYGSATMYKPFESDLLWDS